MQYINFITVKFSGCLATVMLLGYSDGIVTLMYGSSSSLSLNLKLLQQAISFVGNWSLKLYFEKNGLNAYHSICYVILLVSTLTGRM